MLPTEIKEHSDTNSIPLKYKEPLDGIKPDSHWGLHIFKATQQLGVIPLDTKSYYLIGRDQRIADIITDHPSCSLQHAVIQFRKLYQNDERDGVIKPYIIDLDSSNGIRINQSLISSSKYVELLPHDVIQFGFSSKEYVILYESTTKKGSWS
jgi:smad nuclear-interacting protein 1